MWDNMGQYGKSGTIWDNVGQCGTMWDSVGQCGIMWDNVGQCGTMWDNGHEGKTHRIASWRRLPLPGIDILPSFFDLWTPH